MRRLDKRARKAVWITSLLVGTTCFRTGCGTVCNLVSGDPDIYGGVHKDVQIIMTPRATSGINFSGGPLIAGIVAADAGLSAVADTVTLPLVISMRQNRNDTNEVHGSASGEKDRPPAGP